MSVTRDVKQAAKELSEELDKVAKELDLHNRNGCIASVVGGSAAVAGGVVAVVAGIASVFTSGLTTPIAIAGAILAASGGVTSGGSRLTKTIINHVTLREADAKMKAFKTICQQEMHLAVTAPQTRIHVGDRIKKNIPLLHKAAGFVGSAAGAVTTAVPDATQLLGEEVKDAVEILQEGAGALGGTAGGPIAVINAVLLPLTLYNLVDASIELHNVRKEKENSKAGDYLRQVADFLQREIVDKDLIKIDAVGETLA